MADLGTIVTAFQVIYSSLTFIQDVAGRIETYATERDNLRIRVESAVIFIREFETIMFGPGGLYRKSRLQEDLNNNIRKAMLAMQTDIVACKKSMERYLVTDEERARSARPKRAKWAKKLWQMGRWFFHDRQNVLDILDRIEAWTVHLQRLLLFVKTSADHHSGAIRDLMDPFADAMTGTVKCMGCLSHLSPKAKIARIRNLVRRGRKGTLDIPMSNISVEPKSKTNKSDRSQKPQISRGTSKLSLASFGNTPRQPPAASAP